MQGQTGAPGVGSSHSVLQPGMAPPEGLGFAQHARQAGRPACMGLQHCSTPNPLLETPLLTLACTQGAVARMTGAMAVADAVQEMNAQLKAARMKEFDPTHVYAGQGVVADIRKARAAEDAATRHAPGAACWCQHQPAAAWFGACPALMQQHFYQTAEPANPFTTNATSASPAGALGLPVQHEPGHVSGGDPRQAGGALWAWRCCRRQPPRV